MPLPALRLRLANTAPIRASGDHVLYWMIASRRTRWSHALDHAIDRARELGRPLLVLEALRVAYPYASDRHHTFVLHGMADNARAFADSPIGYLPYVEPSPGAGRGLLEALAARACLVVTDDWPGFFLPRMVAAAAARLPVAVEAVDGAGLLPLRAADRRFLRAVDFRRFLARELPAHLARPPRARPLDGLDLPRFLGLDAGLRARWPAASAALLRGEVSGLPIDHDVPPVPIRGGEAAARTRWRAFLAQGLARYEQDRRHPDLDAGSGLSPYLHYGHIGAFELHAGVSEHGAAAADSAAGFLDELVTWRELALNTAARLPDHEQFDSLPDWARRSLEAHAGDPRPVVYDREALEQAQTHDPLWNAAQRQLRQEGRIHNGLRMLWGKKVLQWSAHPRQAMQTLFVLNDRWALDGRDPNSSAGIGWVFGRHDRAWGPERPIFGLVRYMSSESAAQKLRLRRYLARWGPEPRASSSRPS